MRGEEIDEPERRTLAGAGNHRRYGQPGCRLYYGERCAGFRTCARDIEIGQWCPRRHACVISHNIRTTTFTCRSNIEMTPLCKVEVTLARVLGSGEVHRGGGVVDEQAGVQPS